MPVRVEQTPDMPAGQAHLSGANIGHLDAGTIELRIARMDQGSSQFLVPRFSGANACGSADCWFRPEPGPEPGPAAAISIGSSATWHLKPHMPYLVSFRDGSGTTVEDRMSWPAIRLPSEVPPPSRAETVSQTDQAEPEPVSPPAPEPVQAVPEPDPLDHFAAMAEQADITDPEPVTETPPAKPRRRALWLVALAALIAVGAGTYLAWVDPGYLRPVEPAPPPTAVAAPQTDGPEISLAGARAFLKTDPEAEAASEQAERFQAEGEGDAAFLLLAYAARQGDAQAALRLGDLYNPESWTEGVLNAPDPHRAEDYYRQAAEAGVGEAMRKLASLLESGALAVEDAPEQALFWSRKAEEAAQSEEAGQ
ncbi:MAG: hypothetical protein ACFB6S_13460 [Geminicoccaceae bacterium]